MNDTVMHEAERRLPTMLRLVRRQRRRRNAVRVFACAVPLLLIATFVLFQVFSGTSPRVARDETTPADQVTPGDQVAADAADAARRSGVTQVRNDPTIVARLSVSAPELSIVTLTDDQLFAVLSGDGTRRGVVITPTGTRVVVADARPQGRP
jgi:hypothetical protein